MSWHKEIGWLCLALASAGAAMGAELPILGWWGIPEDKVTVERYQEARQAGFTALMQGASSAERMRGFLDKAQCADIKLSVILPEFDEAAVAMLKDHPALLMWHVMDEPRYKHFDMVSNTIRRIEAMDGRHPCYVNHIADSSVSMGVPDYAAYMERALRDFRLRLISADHYPCRLADTTRALPYRDTGNEVYVCSTWYRQLEYLSGLARREHLDLQAADRLGRAHGQLQRLGFVLREAHLEGAGVLHRRLAEHLDDGVDGLHGQRGGRGGVPRAHLRRSHQRVRVFRADQPVVCERAVALRRQVDGDGRVVLI